MSAVAADDQTSAGAPDPQEAYEAPAVVATFAKQDLADHLPENLTPHVHAVQNS